MSAFDLSSFLYPDKSQGRQPRVGTPLNKSHSILRNLDSAVIPGDPGFFTGPAPQNNKGEFNIGDSNKYLVQSTENKTNPWSVFVYAKLNTSDTTVLWTSEETLNSGTYDRRLTIYYTGITEAYIYDGGEKRAQINGSIITGKYILFAAICDGSYIYSYNDGTLSSGVAISNNGYTGYSTPNYVIGYGTGASGPDANIAYAIKLDRAISFDELEFLRRNPWDIFDDELGSLSFMPPTATDISLSLTGIAVTASRGTLSPDASKAISGIQLTLSGGDLGVALAKSLTGQSNEVPLGTVKSSISKDITGQSSTLSQGDFTKSASVTLTGNSFTGYTGTLTPALAKALSGIEAALANGTLTPTSDGNITLTGLSISASQGLLSVSVSKSATGQSVTLYYGAISPELTKALSGLSSALANGTLSPTNDANITLVGLSMTANQGTLGVSNSKSLEGNIVTLYRDSLTPSLDKSITGQAITSASGSVITSTNIDCTGQSITSAQGILTPAASKELTGNSITLSHGDVTFVLRDITLTLTGLEITASLGQLLTDDALLYNGSNTYLIVEGGSKVYLIESINTYIPI